MSVLVWVVEDTFEACVDAVRETVRATEAVRLLHVISSELPDAADAARSPGCWAGHGRAATRARGSPRRLRPPAGGCWTRPLPGWGHGPAR